MSLAKNWFLPCLKLIYNDVFVFTNFDSLFYLSVELLQILQQLNRPLTKLFERYF